MAETIDFAQFLIDEASFVKPTKEIKIWLKALIPSNY